MARPNRLNYATGPAGKKRFVEALRKWQDKQKALKEKAAAKKPVAKKPVAKKPVAKKPVTKKPVTKKPVTKKPPVKKPVAKKPVAKKPVTKKPVAKKPAPKKTANNLKIKKTASTAVKTTKQAIKKATPVVKKGVKTAIKKAGEAKQAIGKKLTGVKKALKKGKAPKPTTPAQKAVSGVYQSAKKGIKTNVPKVLKAVVKNPKAAIKGGVAAYATERLANAVNTRMDREFAKRAGKSLKEYQAGKKKMKNNRNMVKSVKNIVSKFKNRSGTSSTPKKVNTTKPSSKLKIAQDRVKKAKGYNKEKLQREVDYQKKLGKQGRTWSNPVGAEGKGKPSTVKTETPKKKKESKFIKTGKGTLARRGSIAARRAENRERARKRAQEMARQRLANR